MSKVKFGKRFAAGLVALSLVGSGALVSYRLYRNHDVNRVKGYLEDFLTEDNYVDLSKVTSAYDIKGFSGDILYEALEDSGINYVRITDSYIYDGAHVTGFVQKNAVDYNDVLGTDQNGDIIYRMYEPMAVPTDSGVVYEVPEGYTLEDIKVLAEPIRYSELKDKEIKVVENDYEDSYSLYLTNGKRK